MRDFTIIKKLGKGGFGVVILGEHFFTKEQYAFKKIKINKGFPANEVDRIFIEAKSM